MTSTAAEQLLMTVPPLTRPTSPPTYCFPATVPETETHLIVALLMQPKSPRELFPDGLFVQTRLRMACPLPWNEPVNGAESLPTGVQSAPLRSISASSA